jgi:hypothetical protein
MVTQDIYLTDYNTGSTYYALLNGGFGACAFGEYSFSKSLNPYDPIREGICM